MANEKPKSKLAPLMTTPLNPGARGEQVQQLQSYLKKFGYFDSLSQEQMASGVPKSRALAPTLGSFDESTARAVRRYQEFHGLPVSGRVDEATIAQMSMPRCGFPDIPRRAARFSSPTLSAFVAQGNRWPRPNLSYAFDNFTADLTQAQIRTAIQAAFGLWSQVTSLTFAEVATSASPDILIRFVAGDHGDGAANAFDGVGGVLAHAFYPPPNGGSIAGDAHFDEAETWTVNIPVPTGGIDLMTVAAHEFGHSLGLDHSSVAGALMFPTYSGPHRFLSVDDVKGIQSVYGSFTWRFAGNTAGFGHAINDGRPFWTGHFSRSDRSEVLFYYPGDDNWWLGADDGTQLVWTLAGNTAGFGHAINDGRPFWIGDFNGDGRDDVLFYFPGDDNWWLGSHKGPGGQLEWNYMGNTGGFGHGINDGRPFWTGNFSRGDRKEVLFYYPGDDNWWLGSYDGAQLVWSHAGNTAGFGHGINDGRPFFIGDFDGDGCDEVLFYFPGDGNWWLGSHQGAGGQITWSLAGNTAGFGLALNDGRPFFVGNFSRSDRAEILFYSPSDDNWWLGTHNGTQLMWSFAGNTAGFGHAINDGRPFWVGDFNGDGRAEVLFYFPGDGNWWVAPHDGNQLNWRFAGNTLNFGQVWDGRPFWTGRFSNDNRTDMLFYFPGDDNWWLGISGALP